MQVGPIKYDKEEERVFFRSLLLGLLAGLPLGFLLTYMVGFPKYPPDLAARFVSSLFLLTGIESFSLLFSTVLCLSFSKKRKLLHSLYDAAKIIWAFIIVFPVLWIYLALVMSLIIFPLFDVTSWLNSARQYWLGALFLLPFLFLFMLIFLPDQKPRRLVNQLWLILKGRASVPRLSLTEVVPLLLIFAWLLVVFLPLPESSLTFLVTIGGGLAILAYLMSQRAREKRRKDTG